MNKFSKFGFALVLGLMLIACDNNTTENNTEISSDSTETTITPTVQEQPNIPKSIEFVCNNLGDDEYGNPQNEVYLRVDGVDKKIAQIMACDQITKGDYASKDIPATAVAACGGFWAGAGDYFYAILENNQVVVYQGWEEEEQGGRDYHWEKIGK